MVVSSALGIALERVIVRPVYGQHLFQILITLGATIVLEELIRIAWGPNDQVMPVPVTFKGSWDVADVVVLRFPVDRHRAGPRSSTRHAVGAQPHAGGPDRAGRGREPARWCR